MAANGTLAIEHVAPGQLHAAPYNPRKMDDAERKRLERGIHEFGLVDPIIARREDRMVNGELQRLASFPDPFVFPGSWGLSVERIGNSVPPLFMRAIARHLRIEVLDPKTVEAVA